MTPDEFNTLGSQLAKKSIECGLSVVAIDKITNEVTGVAFNTSSAKEDELKADIEGKHSLKLDAVLAIIDESSKDHC